MVFYVYILREIGSNRTYVGYTVNLERRIRQHNGEICGGAKATRGGKWEFAGFLTGFPDSIIALQTEWRLKHPVKKNGSGMKGRLNALQSILLLEKMTANSKILNTDLNLDLYIRDEYLPVSLPKNIKINSLILPVKNCVENRGENTLQEGEDNSNNSDFNPI